MPTRQEMNAFYNVDLITIYLSKAKENWSVKNLDQDLEGNDAEAVVEIDAVAQVNGTEKDNAFEELEIHNQNSLLSSNSNDLILVTHRDDVNEED